MIIHVLLLICAGIFFGVFVYIKANNLMIACVKLKLEKKNEKKNKKKKKKKRRRMEG